MKTLILAINAKYTHTALAPWYLKSAVRAYNAALTEPEILETNINRPQEEILTEIEATGPDVLAVSCYIWNIALVGQLLAELARRLPDCIIVLGGPEVSFNADERLNEMPTVDYIICGEGEAPFVQLLTLLQDSFRVAAGDDPARAVESAEAAKSVADQPDLVAALADIPGLAWRCGESVVLNPQRDSAIGLPESGAGLLNPQQKGMGDTPESGADPPDPFLPEYGEKNTGRMAYVETSRGCPFSCGFCLSGQAGNVRYFDLEQAKHNLIKLANSGAKTVKLVDRTFNCNPARSRELIRFLRESHDAGTVPASVCFHFEVAADLFDLETVELLKSAPPGLFQLETGVQSFHEETLEAISRKTDLAKVRENFLQLRENNNIHLHLDLIAGLPFEDYDTFGNSFDQAFALSPHMLQLGFLKLLHGSRLRKDSLLYGIVYDSQPPYRVQRTNWLDERELADLALCEDALDRLYNSGRFPATVKWLLNGGNAASLEAVGMQSPFQLFSAAGRFIGSSAGMPLEAYIAGVMAFGSSLSGASKARAAGHADGADANCEANEVLRDCLVADWLQTNHVGVLPLCLQKPDPLSGKVERALADAYRKTDARQKANAYQKTGANSSGSAFSPVSEDAIVSLGTRRPYGFGLLYGGGRTQVALADYRQPRPFLGYYPLRLIDVQEVLNA